jgi:hypothetical protein
LALGSLEEEMIKWILIGLIIPISAPRKEFKNEFGMKTVRENLT